MTATLVERRDEFAGEVQDLIPEVRQQARKRRLLWGVGVAAAAIAIGLGILASIGAPRSPTGGAVIPYTGGQPVTVAQQQAVKACQSAFTGYRQTYANSMGKGEATSVILAYKTTAGALDGWRGASRGTFTGYPKSAPFYLCYLQGSWIDNPDQLMGTHTFPEALYILSTPKTHWVRSHVPSRFLDEMSPVIGTATPPPR
jgi:hypothetical protein